MSQGHLLNVSSTIFNSFLLTLVGFYFLLIVKCFMHEHLACIWRATLSHIFAMINWLIDLVNRPFQQVLMKYCWGHSNNDKVILTYHWTYFRICQASDIAEVTREANAAILYRHCSRQFSVKSYWTAIRKSVSRSLWTIVPRRTNISLKKEIMLQLWEVWWTHG